MIRSHRIILAFAVVFLSGPLWPSSAGSEARASARQAVIIDHSCIHLPRIPAEWIEKAKHNLHIAYGHTSHGSQLTSGMAGLFKWKGSPYDWGADAGPGALDLRDYNFDFGKLGIAHDLGNPDRYAWEKATRVYLNVNPEINVIVWSWCWQANGTKAQIDEYIRLMEGLEADFPNVRFVYMTGRLIGQRTGDNVMQRNRQIRDYCLSKGKILYDFGDIESYDPDGRYYGDKLANDACDYDSDGDGVRDRNWAVDWQDAHTGEWYDCPAAHTKPLNANMKAYAAWWLWARLAGWDGR